MNNEFCYIRCYVCIMIYEYVYGRNNKYRNTIMVNALSSFVNTTTNTRKQLNHRFNYNILNLDFYC